MLVALLSGLFSINSYYQPAIAQQQNMTGGAAGGNATTGAVEQHRNSTATNNQTEMQQSPSPQNATIHGFEDAFIGIVNDTRNLSFAYQDEFAKLQSGVYDNQTFVTITDLYLQMYQQLLAEGRCPKTMSGPATPKL